MSEANDENTVSLKVELSPDDVDLLKTHEISEIEMIADDVILIDEGKVSCIFNAEELRTRDGMSIVDKMREVYKGE